jgi:tetratricopeptide (TPR) repeat protein
MLDADELTDVIADLSDEAMALISDEADFEPTALILPEYSDADFPASAPQEEQTHLIDPDVDLKPTSLISPKQRTDTLPVDENRNALPPLPPPFDPIEPFDPNELIDLPTDWVDPVDLAQSDPYDADLEATYLLRPDQEDDDLAEPTRHQADDSTSDLIDMLDSELEVEAGDISAELETMIPPLDQPTDSDATELYLPDDAELAALVESGVEPTELISPDAGLFEDPPTELYFDEFAAMAADVEKLTDDSTEIIAPSEHDFPDYDFPELAEEGTDLIQPNRDFAPEPTAVSIGHADHYIDEPTEPSLERPKLDALSDEATRFIPPQVKGHNHLFEPTIVSEITIDDRWKSIPTDFRPHKQEQSDASAKTLRDEQAIRPTETTSRALNIADDIPDDPDETIAWLEEMARRQKLGISAEQVTPRQSDLTAPAEPLVQSAADPDELATILAEPKETTQHSLLDSTTNERLPANFYDAVDEVSPTIMADLGESGDDGMDAFVREVSQVLDDEREPLETLSREQPPAHESDIELTDALAWLEELVAGSDTPIDEMTIELNETDVNRLLNSYEAAEFDQPTQDISDHPTIYTQIPEISQFEEPADDLDAALSWLEGLDFDDESSLLEPPPMVKRSNVPITLIDYSAARNSARHAFEARSYREAIIIFEDLLQREDKNATDVVIEDLVSWTSKVQDQPPLFRLLGDAYLQRGDYEKAAWTFRRGLTA